MATLAATTIIACNKKDSTPSQSANSSKSKLMDASDATDAAANPNNPYDYVGYNHNVGLQATRATWSSTNATFDASYNAAVNYANTVQAPVNMSESQITTMLTALRADNSDGKETYLSKVGLSQTGAHYASQLCTITTECYNYDSYEAYRNAMIELESAVLADNSLGDNEKGRILSGASVGRHSVLYWAREIGGYNSDPSTNGNPNGPVTDGFFKNLGQWFKDHPIVTADLVGAIGGIGSLAGLFFGALGGSLGAWLS